MRVRVRVWVRVRVRMRVQPAGAGADAGADADADQGPICCVVPAITLPTHCSWYSGLIDVRGWLP